MGNLSKKQFLHFSIFALIAIAVIAVAGIGYFFHEPFAPDRAKAASETWDFSADTGFTHYQTSKTEISGGSAKLIQNGTYPNHHPYLELTSPITSPVTQWTGFTETATKPADTELYYQFQTEKDGDWLYHDGSNWTAAPTATVSSVNSGTQEVTLSDAASFPAASTISVDSASTGSRGPSGSGASYQWTHTVGSGENRYLVITQVHNGCGGHSNTVTVNGSSATLLAGIDGSSTAASGVYGFANPPEGNVTIRVNLSGSGCIHSASGGAISFFGVDQNNPLETIGTGSSSKTISTDPGDLAFAVGLGGSFGSGLDIVPDQSPLHYKVGRSGDGWSTINAGWGNVISDGSAITFSGSYPNVQQTRLYAIALNPGPVEFFGFNAGSSNNVGHFTYTGKTGNTLTGVAGSDGLAAQIDDLDGQDVMLFGANTATDADANITDLPTNNAHFKFRTFLASDGTSTPELDSLSLTGTDAPDANGMLDTSAITKAGSTGEILLTFDLPSALDSNDYLTLQLPSNYDPTGIPSGAGAITSDFTGSPTFTFDSATQEQGGNYTVKINSDGAVASGTGTLTIPDVTATTDGEAVNLPLKIVNGSPDPLQLIAYDGDMPVAAVDPSGGGFRQVYTYPTSEGEVVETTDCPAPDPAKNVQATILSRPTKDVVKLTWDLPFNLGDRVEIRRGTNYIKDPLAMEIIGRVDNTATSFTDETVIAGNTYNYVIYRKSDCSNSANKPIVEVSLPKMAPKEPFPLTLNIKLKTSKSNEEEMVTQLRSLILEAQQKLQETSDQVIQNDESKEETFPTPYTCKEAEKLYKQSQVRYIKDATLLRSQAYERLIKNFLYKAFFCGLPEDITSEEKSLYYEAFLRHIFFYKSELFSDLSQTDLFKSGQLTSQHWNKVDRYLKKILKEHSFIESLLKDAKDKEETKAALLQKLLDLEQENGCDMMSIDLESELQTYQDLIDRSCLKEVLLELPDITQLFSGHKTTIKLEVYGYEKDRIVHTESITTNIFGEASTLVDEFEPGKYDFSVNKPFSIPQVLLGLQANRMALQLDFTQQEPIYFCRGDFNNDNLIDTNDFKKAVEVLSGADSSLTIQDLNVEQDDIINLKDFAAMIQCAGVG